MAQKGAGRRAAANAGEVVSAHHDFRIDGIPADEAGLAAFRDRELAVV